MQDEVTKSIRVAVVTGVFGIAAAFTGAAMKGYAEIKLERTKLDSQLILKALDTESVEQRRGSLEFLVEADLIDNSETKAGLRKYFEGDNPKSPPRIEPFIQSGERAVLTERTEQNASKTDISFFVCDKDKNDRGVEALITQANSALAAKGGSGAVDLKVWGDGLYDEIPLNQLTGFTTLVVDQDHPEYQEGLFLKSTLESVAGLPAVKIVPNSGAQTPWRVSIIVCK